MVDQQYIILDSLTDGVLVINQHYKIVFANRAFRDFQQFPPDELTGVNCYEFAQQQSLPCLKKSVLKTVFLNGVSVTRNHCHTMEDGNTRVYQITVSPLKDEQGRVERLLQMVKDVTDQHRSRTALSASHQELESIFNSAPFTISYLDPQMRIIRLNPAMEKFINVTSDGVKGQYCYDTWGQYSNDEGKKGKQRLCDNCNAQYALKDGKRYVFERRIGDTFFEVSSVPVRDQEDNIIGVLEIGNDITKNKQAEEALELERNNLRNILNSMDDGVYIVNAEYEIEYVNTILKNHFGETRGRKCFNYFYDTNEVCVWCKNDVVFQGETVRWQRYSPKSKKSYDLIDTPLKNPDGTISKLTIFRDITEQKKLQLESDQRLQQLIQSDKLSSLGEVVAGVAHEINNPNSFITYNIPLLEEIWLVLQPLIGERRKHSNDTGLAGLPVSELCQDMSEIIEAIRVGSGRINKVVNNLKDFARMDESALVKSVQLNEIVNKTYSIVGAQLRKSTRNIVFHLEKDLPVVKGHFQKLEQVVANFLTNAGHALQEKKTGKISISTHCNERLHAVTLSIEDNGVGMEDEALGRLFEPFFTTRRDSGGTGLGLSVSYGLVQEHDGRIGVLSKKGTGTCFTLFLPKESDSSLSELHPSILVVDDKKNLQPLRAMLQECVEDRIFSISDQAEVIPFLEEHPEVDIVFLPAKKAQMNGWQLLEQVKKRFPLLTVFMILEKNNEQRTSSTEFVPDYLLQQPFNTEQLMDGLDSITRIRL